MKYGPIPINAAAESKPSLVTIPNVEIVSTGTFKLSTGEATFTEDDLVAAVAALDDPAVRPPRLKLGHTSEFGDAEPCFGRVLNLRLTANRQTILGDFVGVPAWLAEVMDTAYPSRSMEGALNAKTATGKTHRMVIEAVSLLGITLPGVSTLEDLTSYYGTEVPEGTEIVEGEAIAAKTIGGGQQVQASVSTEDVRRAFYETLTDDRYFWWVKDIRLDPDELIVEDDDNGDLYRVPYSVAGTDVNFGEPIPSEVVYVDKSDAVAASSHGRSVAAFASRDESRKQEQENEMDPKQIRASLGLAEDATDEEVHSKIASLKAAEEAANKEAPEGGDPAESEDDEEDEDEEDESEAPAGDEAATKVVDAKVWEETVAAAREGQAARKEQLTERREGVLKAAVDQGKIAPASKDEWRKKLRAAPESTEAELEALSPGLLPVKETAIDASAEAKEYAYDESLFPEIRASRTSNDPITREVN